MDYTKIVPRTKSEQYEDCRQMAALAANINGKPCDICFGLGQRGYIEKDNYYIPCDCVEKAAKKIRKEKRNKVPHEINPEENN